MKDAEDQRTGYCRALGHDVPFGYCRTVNGGAPCRKIRDCWFERFDVEAFINGHYSAEEQQAIFAPPPSKLATIVDLINKAKGRQ